MVNSRRASAPSAAPRDSVKSSPASPTPPQNAAAAEEPAPRSHTVYPSTGPDLIAFIQERYPERLAGGISSEGTEGTEGTEGINHGGTELTEES